MRYNGNKFSVYESEEKTVLGLLDELGSHVNHNTDNLKNKTDLYGDHKGSWQGLSRPTLSEEGMRATVEDIIDNKIPSIQSSLDGIITLNNKKDFYVTPEMFGANGDGITDDTKALQDAINTNKIVICAKKYLFSSINITCDNFIVSGELISNLSNGYGIILSKSNSNIFIQKYTSNCGGFDIVPNGNIIYGLTLQVKECICEDNCINYTQNNKALQYCTFKGFYVSNNRNGLNVTLTTTFTDTWFNENSFVDVHFQCPNGYAINLVGENTRCIDGLYFDNVSPEGSKYFINAKNVYNIIFNSPRVEEISIIKGYTYKCIFLTGNTDIQFNDIYCYANCIDNNSQTSGTVVLTGVILNNVGTKLYDRIDYDGKKVVNVKLKNPYDTISNNILSKTFNYPLLNNFDSTPFKLFIVSGSTIVIPDEYFVDNQKTLTFDINRFSIYADITVKNTSGDVIVTIDNTGTDNRLFLKCVVACGKIFLV